MSNLLRFSEYPTGKRMEITQGDLTLEALDAIVNAANANLQHGGGIAGAIVRRGGWKIQHESNAWVSQYGPVQHDQPAYTSAGDLACRYVIHAVGPVLGEGDEDTKLASAVTGALHCAGKLDLQSVAIPAISTGIFGFPKERAARIIFEQIEKFLTTGTSSVHLVRLVLFDQPTVDVFLQVWDSLKHL